MAADDVFCPDPESWPVYFNTNKHMGTGTALCGGSWSVGTLRASQRKWLNANSNVVEYLEESKSLHCKVSVIFQPKSQGCDLLLIMFCWDFIHFLQYLPYYSYQ